jgi:hypothetical protein
MDFVECIRNQRRGTDVATSRAGLPVDVGFEPKKEKGCGFATEVEL